MAIYHEDIVNIDLESGTIHRSFAHRAIGYGDDDANRFGIRAYRSGVAEELNGTCDGYFIRADGQTVVITDGVVSGNEAYVTLPEACYAVEGQFALAIKVSGSGVTGTMRIVDGVVSRTSTSATVDPGTLIPSIEDLIEEIEAAVASIPADYSALSSAVKYSFGDAGKPFENTCEQVATVYTSVSGTLDENGFYEESEDYVIRKIVVTPGELILIKPGHSYNKWQFMNSAYIPASATQDSTIFGQPARIVNQDVYTIVPDGAYYLMMVDTSNNTSRYVYHVGEDYKVQKGNVVINADKLTNGSYTTNLTTWVYSLERLRTVAPILAGQNDVIKYTIPSGYTAYLCYFTKTGATISEATATGTSTNRPPVNAFYMLPVIKKTNGGAIIPGDANGISIIVKRGAARLAGCSKNICGKVVGNRTYIGLTGLEEESSSGQWDRTEMFAVEPGTEYLASAFSRKDKIPTNMYLAYYDIEKRYMTTVQITNTGTFTTPEDAHNMIISGGLADIEYLYISKSSYVPMIYKSADENGMNGKYENESESRTMISYAKNGLNYLGTYSVPIYPHGSKYAFIGAKYAGFDAVLIDVIMTTDGHFVVSHNDDLSSLAKNDNGTALGTFKISEHTLAQVKAVDMGYDYGARYHGTRIQTLEEILEVVKPLKMKIIVEPELDPIGDTYYTNLVNIVKSYGFTSDCVMFSYNKSELEIAKGIVPEIGLMIYCGSAAQSDGKITDAISLVSDRNRVYVNAFANASGTYANVLTRTQIERMIANGVHYCVSSPDSEPDGFNTFMSSAPLAWYASMFGTIAYPASEMCIENAT